MNSRAGTRVTNPYDGLGLNRAAIYVKMDDDSICCISYAAYEIQTNLLICMSIRKTKLISTRFGINKSMWSFIDIMLYLPSIRIEKLNWDFFSLNYLILKIKTQSLLSSGSQTLVHVGTIFNDSIGIFPLRSLWTRWVVSPRKRKKKSSEGVF